MSRVLVCLFAATALMMTGCVTSRDGAEQSASRQQAEALPPMMPVEELGSSNVRPPITGSCGMEDLQQYVGRPRTTVSVHVLSARYRILGPNTVTTMDYQPDRLTVRIDARDRIESISCG